MSLSITITVTINGTTIAPLSKLHCSIFCFAALIKYMYSYALFALCAESCRPLSKPASGLFTCLALHKRSLFTGGLDGTLCEVELSENHALVVSMCDVGAPITSLSFNPSHHSLAVGSSKVGLVLVFVFARKTW
jgi:WD40 repeat protein